jgi:hypothetical protein
VAIGENVPCQTPPVRIPEMTGPIPTRDGDIVISHDDTSWSMYSVWCVAIDGQQACGETESSAAMGRPGALKLAKLMARESRGAIYILDSGSAAWIKLSD